MKKYLVAILVVLTMLVAQVGIVAAAPMADGIVTFAGVQYVAGKGPVFTFKVSGKFSKAQLKGSLHVENGADFTLHCTQVDAKTVTCNVSQKVSGVNAVVTWGGATFWVYVPEAPTVQSEYCYNVYDYDLDYVWQSYGTHCQGVPAQFGDMIPWYNPDWDDYYDAIFYWEGPICSGIVEDAYYYPYFECGV